MVISRNDSFVFQKNMCYNPRCERAVSEARLPHLSHATVNVTIPRAKEGTVNHLLDILIHILVISSQIIQVSYTRRKEDNDG